jgi:hypothetical protein
LSPIFDLSNAYYVFDHAARTSGIMRHLELTGPMLPKFAAMHNFSAITVSGCEMREHRLPGRANLCPTQPLLSAIGPPVWSELQYCAETTMPRFRQNSRRLMMEMTRGRRFGAFRGTRARIFASADVVQIGLAIGRG